MHGYHKKPMLIEFFAIVYLLNPLGNLLFTWFNYPQYSLLEVLSKIGRLAADGNLFVLITLLLWVSAVPLAYGLYKVRLWAWTYFLIHATASFIISFFSGEGFHPTLASLINFIFLIPIGYFISAEIRTPYFNPRLRWWEQTPRFEKAVQVKVQNSPCSTFDISENGAFIIDQGEIMVQPGDRLPIELQLESGKLDLKGEVRWLNLTKDKYPKGYGIRFIDISPENRKIIRKQLKALTCEGKLPTRG